MAVTGMQWSSFAVLIGGQHFHWCDMRRDEGAIKTLIELEEEFWHLVKTGTAPPADDSDSTTKTLARLYPRASEKAIALGTEFYFHARMRVQLKNAAKFIEKKLQAIDNLLKAAIGEAEIGLLEDGAGFSWKNQHRDGYSVPDADFRVLREIKSRKAR
jgi:predicted phage-related endonuclease